jgi:NADPH-dependent 2,4-dienoyl-CoA reductase/sulfur reductase-like enzyme
MVYDDNGAHPGMAAAEFAGDAGAQVEIVTPERYFAPEVGGLNHAIYGRAFSRNGTRITISTRLLSVRKDGNALVATLGNDFGPEREERVVDQVIVEHGTLPMSELYETLKPLSRNRGEIDYAAMLQGRMAFPNRAPDAAFYLCRLGDAVTSRNIHGAIYDAVRFAKDF